jgi:drug/metabolite transporter (DMT)-like permease
MSPKRVSQRFLSSRNARLRFLPFWARKVSDSTSIPLPALTDGGSPRRTSSGQALGFMAASAILFAMMNFFARIATTSTSWSTVGAVRAITGALVALSLARLRGRSVIPKDKRAVLWRSFLGTLSMIGTFYAVSSRSVSLGDIVTLLNLAPVFLAVLAPFVLRERTSPAVAVAIAIALGGVVLVVRPTFLFALPLATGDAVTAAVVGSPSPAVTAAVAVGAAASTALAMMLLRRVGQTEYAETIAFQFSVFSALTMIVISLFDLRLPSLRDAAAMLAGGLCAGVAQLAMTRAYTLEQAARVSGMSYLSVVASALLGALVLDEVPGPTTILGMTLVIAGGVLITFVRTQPAK